MIKKTKKYYYGESGGLNPNDPKVTQQLKEMMPEESLKEYNVENCSECHALNNAFLDGAKKENLQFSTVEITRPRKGNNNKTNLKDNPPCENCQITTDGIERKDGN